MQVAEAVHVRAWRAELALAFERRGPRTVIAARRHDGPLVVQRPFYPEGDAVCHAIVVHPPAGIAGGDALEVAVAAADGANALLTTPGAAKWYRSAGPWASQRLVFDLAAGACLEWLPQETIVFDGARARLDAEIRLAGDARYAGWEILCLGRTGAGERFTRGECRLCTSIARDGRPLWFERGRFAGSDALLAAPAGLAGEPVCGTFVVVAPDIGEAALGAGRALAPRVGRGAVTRLPGLLVARYLGPSSEAAREYFAALWAAWRPHYRGRPAVAPRIWNT